MTVKAFPLDIKFKIVYLLYLDLNFQHVNITSVQKIDNSADCSNFAWIHCENHKDKIVRDSKVTWLDDEPKSIAKSKNIFYFTFSNELVCVEVFIMLMLMCIRNILILIAMIEYIFYYTLIGI